MTVIWEGAGGGENPLEFSGDLEPHESPDGVLPSGNWRSACALRKSPGSSSGSQGWSVPAAELAFSCCWAGGVVCVTRAGG